MGDVVDARGVKDVLVGSGREGRHDGEPRTLIIQTTLTSSITRSGIFPVMARRVNVTPVRGTFPRMAPITSLASSDQYSTAKRTESGILQSSISEALVQDFVYHFIVLLEHVGEC